MMPKMNNKMVAICSVAVGAVYLAGFASSNHTAAVQQQAVSRKIQQSKQTVAQPSQQAEDNNQSTTQSNKQTSSQKPKQTPSPSANKVYKDGTFNGTASNRIGSVSVAVTFKNDKITNVDITSADTHYPVDYIQDLPNEVVQNQNAQVDNVSGATLSTEDFQYAVEQAIDQAKL